MNQLIVVSPLVVMMFVSSITPGPNNLMLMLAGTRFGFVRTLPHLAGVSLGATLVICLTFAGCGVVLLGHPRVVNAMTLVCGAYLVWLATRLLKAGPVPQTEPQSVGRPMRWHEAFAFQFVNPKLWTMALAATSIAARFPFSAQTSLGLVAAITLGVNTPCVALWAACGRMLRHWLADARARQCFDVAMAALVIGTAVWIVWPVFMMPVSPP